MNKLITYTARTGISTPLSIKGQKTPNSGVFQYPVFSVSFQLQYLHVQSTELNADKYVTYFHHIIPGLQHHIATTMTFHAWKCYHILFPGLLTLPVPHFSDCSKMSLPNRSGPYWSNPPFFLFLTFGLSGAQS